MDVEVNGSLKAFNTFGVEARARRLVHVTDLDELLAALRLADRLGIPHMLLGGGSNVLFVDDYPGVVIHMASQGIEMDLPRAHMHIAAGENWHQTVETALSHHLYGLENLALIPGSVGAAPVQNIGAYGVELSQCLDYVDVLDIETSLVTRMSAEECRFAYRDSIFKQELKRRSIILAVGLQLSREARVETSYPSLSAHLGSRLAPVLADSAEMSSETPITPEIVFEAVCEIRRSRLPDPQQLGNAGSFFKNPVLSFEQLKELQKDYPDAPYYEHAENQVKVPAAWLIETDGWKGHRSGDAGVHTEQALVLVNHGGATGQQIIQLARLIAAGVRRRFNITLNPEVRIVPERTAPEGIGPERTAPEGIAPEGTAPERVDG